ncbi:TPA: hypothetical protein U1D13_000628 [Streptococcus suis]|uniref:hypothetical protein n=1 Tax=Streptococcus suis TaxID=1307 RepID=UPI002410716B|nr:hypothetical protein [Streptococcus suis]MDG3136920.1 hypothetical protein [Streptococcus suis]HEM3630743.1 hypothetical protein [Streptococcus suis]HEM3657631.1 hypothetical protein [Streptococcus suis]HEM3699846.1 hypothetical protein [Streptococcus suis]HEM3714612.1 hypothetical protein [Streptococcus suis]
MAENRTQEDKKVLAVSQELSQALVTYKWEEAWTKAGELNGLLKNREGLTLPPYMLDMLVQHLKSFYYQNNQINKAHKAMSAIGHKLEEFK